MITGKCAITRTGLRLASTLALAGAASSVGKVVFGRPRPGDSFDADGYLPFSGQEAMPSGHTAMAFAMATTLADDIDRTWASVGLYTVAGGVAWSRINDNRHWLTDVVAGAAVGIASSKLISGRWRIFGLRPPDVLISSSPALAWNIAWTAGLNVYPSGRKLRLTFDYLSRRIGEPAESHGRVLAQVQAKF
jgi:membrane-associated phospholipid phosphatase